MAYQEVHREGVFLIKFPLCDLDITIGIIYSSLVSCVWYFYDSTDFNLAP
jgi:hypothetical protein